MTTGPVIIYQAGQTYPSAVNRRTQPDVINQLLSQAEVGAIFSFFEYGQTIYRIVSIVPGRVSEKGLEVYSPLIESAIDLTDPPNRAQIDASNVGDLFRYRPRIEPVIQYLRTVEISGRKYVQPFALAENTITSYLPPSQTDPNRNKAYYISAWPHVSTVQPGAILQWGDRRYIAVQLGSSIIFDDYLEIFSWPINTVWAPPAIEDDLTTVNWSNRTQWNTANPNVWPVFTTGQSTQQAAQVILQNFADYIGWTLTIQAGLGSSTRGEPHRLTADGVEIVIPRFSAKTITFTFNEPIRIDQVAFDFEASNRINNLYTTGPLILRNIKHPRYPKAEWTGADLIGADTVAEYNAPNGWVAGPLSAPFGAADAGLSEPVLGFSFEVDNRNVSFDVRATIKNWRIRQVSPQTQYRVDYDLANQEYIGRALDGSSDVILTDQYKEKGWTQTQDSVFDQEAIPTLKWDRTEGFLTAESFWMSNNNVMWRCRDDAIGDAAWNEQSVLSITHPFHNVSLETIRRSAPDTTDIDPYSVGNQGIYAIFETEDRLTEALAIRPGFASFKYLNDQDKVQGLPVPFLNLTRNSNGTNRIELSSDNFSAEYLNTLLNRGASFSDYFIPGSDIFLTAGSAFYNARGGDISLAAGASIGTDQPGGIIKFSIPDGRDSNSTGFAPRSTVPQDQKGNRGSIQFAFTENGIEYITQWPKTKPDVGQALIVKDRLEERIGDFLQSETAILDWGESGKDQIIRSAIAPTVMTTKPEWELWYEESPRVLKQYTYYQSGDTYKPIAIPWCCHPVREYNLLKPYEIDRQTTAPPASVDEPPTWQIWIEESENELKRYTWAKVGDKYLTLPIPWISRAQDSSLRPELVLTKPSSGTLDATTNTDEAQYIRSNSAPSSDPSLTRPTWEFWIHEESNTLRQYTIAKVTEGYIPIPLPWLATVQNFSVIDEFELRKSAPSGVEGAINTSIIGEIHRASESPQSAYSVKPGWQIWIRETDLALYWFTWAHVGDEYISISLPWYSSTQDGQVVNHFELLKPLPLSP